MIIGAAAGSTVGGIKLIRAITLVKGIEYRIQGVFYPEQAIFDSVDRDLLVTPNEVSCISSSPIVGTNGTATTTFTIAEGCEPVELTLASYLKVGLDDLGSDPKAS